jgi:hypothetical protein
MRTPPSEDRFHLQSWHMTAGSIVILLHLAAVAICGFMMESGPWPTDMGQSSALPPQFAQAGYRVAGPVYFEGLRIGPGSRYLTNRPGQQPGIWFEFRLKDDKGNITQVLKFPDAKANPWVRHRQSILAMWLGQDRPMQPLESEVIQPAGKRQERRTVWRDLTLMSFQGSRWHVRDKEGKLLTPEPLETDKLREMLDQEKQRPVGENRPRIHEVSENQVDWEPVEMMKLAFNTPPNVSRLWLVQRDVNTLPRQAQLPEPNEWAMIVAKSYGRHLCRVHGAASAELVRISQMPYPPVVLFVPEGRSMMGFGQLESFYGKVAP